MVLEYHPLTNWTNRQVNDFRQRDTFPRKRNNNQVNLWKSCGNGQPNARFPLGLLCRVGGFPII